MNLSIGILAYNEERNIATTIGAIADQDLFTVAGHDIEVVCVPNGCRDRTAAVAEEALAALRRRHPRAAARVEVVDRPGKANAWNRYVHGFARPETEAFILLDADIVFGQPGCLRRVVEELAAHPEAVVAVDVPLKDIAAKAELSAREKLSLAASEAQRAGTPKLAGSLYVARAAALRAIVMPLGLLVEDGFLKAMLLTRNFTAPEDVRLIVRADDATHYFEAVTDFVRWFKHEKRLMTGTAVNIVLFEYLREEVRTGRAASDAIRRRNAEDAEWVATLARERLARGGGIPGAAETIRLPLAQLGRMPKGRALRSLPGALLRSALNLAVARACARDLRTGRLAW